MIYLDYSATTPVNSEVLTSFVTVSTKYIGNPNSIHQLGVEVKQIMNQACQQVANLLQVKPSEVIFTSCASESNSMALLGTIQKYPLRGKHIITTRLEHSSILETVEYLKTFDYEIEYVNVTETGKIDLIHLKQLLRKDTVLVSIHHVNSEIGVHQDMEQIASILREYPTTLFHVDGTQAVGKIPICLKDVDLYTFGAHKFYGLNGIACLIKKEKVLLEPLIHGGKSQTIYRSGTPSVALIVSLAKALRLAMTTVEEHEKQVTTLHDYLIQKLSNIHEVVMNSTIESVPHIVNISIPGIKPETLLHDLEQKEIYISTKTACSKDQSSSLSLLAMGKETTIAVSSIRISLSHLTTIQELEKFTKELKKSIKKLLF